MQDQVERTLQEVEYFAMTPEERAQKKADEKAGRIADLAIYGFLGLAWLVGFITGAAFVLWHEVK